MPHTTYDLAPIHALSDGHNLEVTKYVLSLDPCISVGLGLQPWSEVISGGGAANVAIGQVTARTDDKNQVTLMMAPATTVNDQ